MIKTKKRFQGTVHTHKHSLPGAKKKSYKIILAHEKLLRSSHLPNIHVEHMEEDHSVVDDPLQFGGFVGQLVALPVVWGHMPVSTGFDMRV